MCLCLRCVCCRLQGSTCVRSRGYARASWVRICLQESPCQGQEHEPLHAETIRRSNPSLDSSRSIHLGHAPKLLGTCFFPGVITAPTAPGSGQRINEMKIHT